MFSPLGLLIGKVTNSSVKILWDSQFYFHAAKREVMERKEALVWVMVSWDSFMKERNVWHWWYAVLVTVLRVREEMCTYGKRGAVKTTEPVGSPSITVYCTARPTCTSPCIKHQEWRWPLEHNVSSNQSDSLVQGENTFFILDKLLKENHEFSEM